MQLAVIDVLYTNNNESDQRFDEGDIHLTESDSYEEEENDILDSEEFVETFQNHEKKEVFEKSMGPLKKNVRKNNV